jgi:hypothetical protein
VSRPFPVLSGHVSSQDGAEAQLATRFAAYLAERPALDAWFARVGELAEVQAGESVEDVAAEVAAVLARKREAMETAAAAVVEEAAAAEAAPAPAAEGAGEEVEGASPPAPAEGEGAAAEGEGEGAAAEGGAEGAAAGEEGAAADADADTGAGAAAPAAEAGSVHRSMASLALERWGACEQVSPPLPPPSLPYKVDTSRPSLRTNWTRLGVRAGLRARRARGARAAACGPGCAGRAPARYLRGAPRPPCCFARAGPEGGSARAGVLS